MDDFATYMRIVLGFYNLIEWLAQSEIYIYIYMTKILKKINWLNSSSFLDFLSSLSHEISLILIKILYLHWVNHLLWL